VSRYARYRRGPHAWMLGRFIVPCRRLDEFEAEMRAQAQAQEQVQLQLQLDEHASLSDSASATDAEPWRLSVLASQDVSADRVAIEVFNTRCRDAADGARSASRACIDAVEVKVDSADDVRRIAAALSGPLRVWFEIAPGPALGSLLDAIAPVGECAGAKLRTGGVTPDAIPEAHAVAHFLLACTRARVACKATAGLHHPIHAAHRLTYADDSPTAFMHGFVNVFLAAALARDLVRQHERADADITETLVALLDERDAHHIVWHDDHVMWRGHRLDAQAIASSREHFARSFGSCSFEEPIEDLEQLGWL
jgi:hypothetical protein